MRHAQLFGIRNVPNVYHDGGSELQIQTSIRKKQTYSPGCTVDVDERKFNFNVVSQERLRT